VLAVLLLAGEDLVDDRWGEIHAEDQLPPEHPLPLPVAVLGFRFEFSPVLSLGASSASALASALESSPASSFDAPAPAAERERTSSESRRRSLCPVASTVITCRERRSFESSSLPGKTPFVS